MGIISRYEFRVVQVERIAEALSRYVCVPMVKIVLFDFIRIVRDNADEAVFPVKPSKDAQVGGLKFPNTVRDKSEGFEVPSIGQTLPGTELYGQISELLQRA
jgi:hypothetical protein